MDMNKAFYLRKEDRNPQWRVMDAQGQSLGRLAVQIANALRGKDQAMYTPHTDSGDYVVVINASGIINYNIITTICMRCIHCLIFTT